MAETAIVRDAESAEQGKHIFKLNTLVNMRCELCLDTFKTRSLHFFLVPKIGERPFNASPSRLAIDEIS